MDDMRSEPVSLDRAYSDGKLAGYLGTKTGADCPYGGDRTALRIAWLDGLDHGIWKATPVVSFSGRVDTYNWNASDAGQAGRAITNIAIAHLRRLMNAIGQDETQSSKVNAALNAATMFVRLAGRR